MNRQSLTRQHRMRSLMTALLLLNISAAAVGADLYDPATGQLTMATVSIGSATYSNMVVIVGKIVSGPTGTTPVGSLDSYNPANGQLTVPSVLVGGTSYFNAVVTIQALVSVGSVFGVDTYNGTTLSIPTVKVLGGSAYSNVVVKPGNVISAGGGMPTGVRDVYDPATGLLTIAAIQLGSKVYTDAIIAISTIVSVGANNGTLNGSFGVASYFFTGGVTQPPTPAAGAPQAKPLGFSSTNTTITFDGAGNYAASGTANTDGSGSAGSLTGTYHVNSNGSFTLTTNGSNDVESGYLLAGGNVLNFSKNPGNVPSIGIGIKTGTTGFSNASLNGSFGVASYFFTGGITQPPTPAAGAPQAKPLGFSSTNTTIMFDGAGNYAASGTANTDGSGSAGSLTGTYHVNSNGSFTLTTNGSNDVESGYLLAGANVLNFSKNPGNVPSIGIGIAQ